MPRCELTGKGPVVKNLVSHSNIKTKSRAFINVQQKRVFSRVLNEMVNLKMATATIRDMEHAGGFDNFIMNQPEEKLSKRAMTIKTRMKRKLRSGEKNQGAKA
ncbi:MAG: 50S ribosomal protein L28 [Bdellovibrionales bacterium]|nr:50S ribosomal protein L28 [Bdellovibrionales bacterium]